MTTRITSVYAHILSILFCLSSCNDFLDQDPLSAISPEKYLVEASQLEAYANGLYTILPSGVDFLIGDEHTDNMAALSFSNKFVPGEWRVSQNATALFDNIYNCNYFLENVLPRYEAGTLTGSVENIRHFIGEIYFFRAFEYFSKYQLYGDFPIVKQTLADDLEILTEASKRAPRNEVARFILSDLDKAIDFLKTGAGSTKTRISKETALLLKSRVGLYEGTFLKYFAGTAFVPNGMGWPGAEKGYHQNYAFPSGNLEAEINYFLDQAIDAAKQLADAITLTENTGKVQQSASEPANPYMDMYASINPSGYSEVLLWREYNRGVGAYHALGEYTQRGNRGRGTTRGMVQSFLMENGLPIYAPNSGYRGDDYIADVRASRDNRLVLFLKEPGQKNILWEDPSGTEAWPIEPEPNIIGTNGTDISRIYTTGYALRKWNPWDQEQLVSINGSGAYTGIIIFRGTEALLNYIEAYYERHGSLDGTAIQYWQNIRTRAKVDHDFNKTIAATVMTEEAPNDWGAYSAGKLIDATLYNIRRERRNEFIGEGRRWMDLQRWRSLDQLITSGYHIEGIKLWGPMQNWYKKADGSSALTYGLNLPGALVSPPERSEYLRPYEKSSQSLVLEGYRWTMAHYLNPLAIQDIMITSKDNNISTSPMYQNPGWPLVANEGAIN